MNKEELESLLMGRVDHVSGEVRFEDRNSGETLVEPIKAENPITVDPETDVGGTTVELEWSRSMSYNKISLKVRLYTPANPENLDGTARELIKKADSLIREYAYGTAEPELESWANDKKYY